MMKEAKFKMLITLITKFDELLRDVRYLVDLGNSVCAMPGPAPVLGACNSAFGFPPECEAQSLCLFTQCVQYCNRDGGSPSCATGPCGNAEGAPWGICRQGTACDPL